MFSARLRKASYNGISFEVTGSDFNFGRRTVTYEYPVRDEPYTEDLGRLKRQFTLSGFIVGSDYLVKTQKLIDAIENCNIKANGKVEPGKLIHPWLGKLNVYPIETPKVSWDAQKRISNFTITFIEAGEFKYPAGDSGAWGNKLRAFADNLADNILNTFNVSVADIEDFNTLVTSIANGSFQNIVGCLSDSTFVKIFDLSDSVADLVKTVATDLNTSSNQFVKSLFNALGVGGYSTTIQNWRDAADAVNKLLHKNEIKAEDKTVAEDSSGSAVKETDTESQKEELETAVKDTVRLVIIAQYIGIISMIGTNLDGENADDEDTAGEPKSEDEILDIRNEALEVIEAEMIYQGSDESNLYDTLADIYQSVYHYLTDEVLSDSTTETVTPSEPKPALVFTYEQYGETERIEDVVNRNDIHFPLFMAVKPIRINKTVSK